MVRACVSRIDSSQMFRPADATTAVIEWGRWIAMPSTEVLTDARNKHPGRALAASIVRRDGWARALCVDGVMLSSAQIAQSAEVKLLVPTRAYPVDGGCAAPFNERRGGRWLLQTLCTYTVYDQARLDMRLVWNGGAGAWHTAVGGRGFGLVELFATGAGPKRTNVRLEVRAIDRDGSVFYRVGGSVEVPIGSVTR